jgi:hypothetical protein
VYITFSRDSAANPHPIVTSHAAYVFQLNNDDSTVNRKNNVICYCDYIHKNHSYGFMMKTVKRLSRRLISHPRARFFFTPLHDQGGKITPSLSQFLRLPPCFRVKKLNCAVRNAPGLNRKSEIQNGGRINRKYLHLRFCML